MNNPTSLYRRFISISVVSLVSASSFTGYAFAGKEEETRTKLESAHFSVIRGHILGHKEIKNDQDRLFDQITDKKIRDLNIRKFERQLQDRRYLEERIIPGLLTDLNKNVFSFLDHLDCARASNVSTAYHEIATDPKVHLARLQSLLGPFVTIPEGYLPLQEGEEEAKVIGSFDLNSYPVTRDLWMEVMRKIPDHVPQAERATWANCKKCPVNYVAYENKDFTPAEIQEFLKRLNKKTQTLKCTYDLPTDDQLLYSIRGDVSGQNQDLYSKDVTDDNLNEYVTYWHGAPDAAIQPVGTKRLNKFGIELGNVWKMSKSIDHPDRPHLGRSIRGGGWASDARHVRSSSAGCANTGYYDRTIGFSLLRTCH